MAILHLKFIIWLFSLILMITLPPCSGDYILLPGGKMNKMSSIFSNIVKSPADYNITDGEEFEYVVVGAGAGGAAVAARLAQAGKSVILLEAGGHAPFYSYIPGLVMSLMGSSIDWQYDTKTNNMSCLGTEGGQCRWSRGKALGGSTTMMHMLYVRGNPNDYNLGIPGWTWQELKPYFLRYEGLQTQSLHELPSSSIPYHNTSGILGISFCEDPENIWHSHIVEGLQSLGVPFNPDINAESQIGVTRVLTFINKGVRQSTARGYLLQDDVQKALRISKETYVTRVLFDEDNAAKAVTAVQGESRRSITVRAKEGVILSAGIIGTTQILMHSGIGPRQVLQKFNIPVRADLPVGENVSDHVLPIIFIRVDSSIYEILRYGRGILEYQLNRKGFLASIGVEDITTFINTSCYDTSSRRLRSGSSCELPTTQFVHSYVDRGILNFGGSAAKKASYLNDNILRKIKAENALSGILIITPVVLKPYSRGYIHIKSADPLEQPEIFPNYLSDKRDVEEMLRSITIIEHLIETPLFREKNARIINFDLKGCPSFENEREAYWRCYIRHLTQTPFHAAGSCALGQVLDPKLGVLGLKKTYVGDLSAMPQVPRAPTAALSIAIGERLADFLLK